MLQVLMGVTMFSGCVVAVPMSMVMRMLMLPLDVVGREPVLELTDCSHCTM